jgi:hypothetical protein
MFDSAGPVNNETASALAKRKIRYQERPQTLFDRVERLVNVALDPRRGETKAYTQVKSLNAPLKPVVDRLGDHFGAFGG